MAGDNYALKKELLSEEELLSVIHRQGFDNFEDVSRCVLEPNGAFYIEGRKPSADEDCQNTLLTQLEEPSEVRALRERLA